MTTTDKNYTGARHLFRETESKWKRQRYADRTGWGVRHWMAWRHKADTNGRAYLDVVPEFRAMILAMATYADVHYHRFGGSGIASDYVLGDAWYQVLDGVRKLLNGDIGALDAGSIDKLLVGMMEGEGFNVDQSVVSTDGLVRSDRDDG